MSRTEEETRQNMVNAHEEFAESTEVDVGSSVAKLRQEDMDALRTFIQQHPEILDESKDPMQVIAESQQKNGNVSSKAPKKRPNKAWSALRTLLVDLPLALLFSVFCTSLVFREIHNDYFVPFFKAAAVSNERLTNEHTYYERSCSFVDVSTDDIRDLVIDVDSNSSSSDDAVESVMIHGGVVIPKILKPSTIKELREFVVRRNDEIWEKGEAYPVSQGYKRSSFGIDAAEDPIVAVALKEVATNPVLRPTIRKLVGPDAAVAEITAITAYEGCEEQAWHSDVKIDGNAVKFARTFTHSYSLFITLQDTSSEMGATELCPGTQFCADEDLIALCDRYGMQISEASEDELWHAGDGALLSQQVWHRGHAHTDENAPERIVFIVTFISRPQLGKDQRQLSRGTYFHLKWNMWGHTYQDLLDADVSMAKPYSVLRCLGLWKPPKRNWGFDLLTSSVMRIANSQSGFEYEDLPTFIDNVIGMIHLPEFLQGPVLQQEGAYQIYLQQTLDKTYYFFSTANAIVLTVYVLIIIGLQLSGAFQGKRILVRALRRLALSHGVIFLLGHWLLRHVANSEFGTNIRKGRTLAPSFPPPVKGVPKLWTTTLPERNDVLVGSRFDGKHLWAYNRWLDYHPGNADFRDDVANLADLYVMYEENPVFAEQLLQSITKSAGRFLQQDYESGDWVVMSPSEARNHTKRALLLQHYPALAAVDGALSFLLADYRFGFHRGTRLARDSQSFLLHLKEMLFAEAESTSVSIVAAMRGKSTERPLSTPGFLNLRLWAENHKHVSHSAQKSLHQRSTLGKKQDEYDFHVGDVVMGNWEGQGEGEWYKGVISEAYDDDTFDVAYYDGSDEQFKPREHLVKHLPLETGDRVRVDHRGQGTWFYATVLRVAPSGVLEVEYDDGALEHNVHPYYYRAGVDMFPM